MKSGLWLLAPIFALGQVRQIATLPLEPKALAVDSAGNIYMAGNTRYASIDNSASLPALNRYRNRAIVASADAGATWTPIGDVPTKTSVQSVAADPWTPGVLMATAQDGIWKTTDSGAHWRNVLVDYYASYDPAIRGHVLSSHYYSTDGGETWSLQRQAEVRQGAYAFDPRGNGTVLDAGGFGSLGNYAISRDGGRTWSVRPPPQTYSPRGFVFDLMRPDVVYGWGFGVLFRSGDDGQTFIVKGVPFYASALSVDPAQPGRLYGIDGRNIWRSDDLGDTWQRVVTTPLDHYVTGPLVRSCGALIGGDWYTTIRSIDNGATWTAGAAVESVAAGAGCLFYGKVSPQSVYLAKYSPDGQRLLWGAYLDGPRPVTDIAGIVVDAADNVIVAGTSSLASLTDAKPIPAVDVWVARLDSAGNLIYSTGFGGDQDEAVSAVAVDGGGAAYVAGTTRSRNFPVTPDAAQSAFGGGSTDAFLAVLGNAGDLRYATFLGGSGDDTATGVGVDSQGRIAVGGNSANGPQGTLGFLARLEGAGEQFQFSGGVTGADSVDAVAIGSDGSIYTSGLTGSPDFALTVAPFANGLNAAPAPSAPCASGDRFLLRLEPDSLRPIYSARFGTNCQDRYVGLQVRPDGAAMLQSFASDTFPHRAALAIGGGLFWTEVAPDGSALRYSGPLRSLGQLVTPFAALAPGGTLLSIGPTFALRSALERVAIPAPPEISIDHVANAFSGTGLSVAPGGLYSLSGAGIGPGAPLWLGLDAANPPTELGGVRVLFDATPARLLYASENRIICIAPEGLNPSSVHVEFAGRESNPVGLNSSQSDVGLLVGNSLPAGGLQPLPENADGSPNRPDNPVARGSVIVLYATGLLPASPFVMIGRAVPASVTRDTRFEARVYRIEATVPADTPAGSITVQLASQFLDRIFGGGILRYSTFGNPVTIYVK